jgi:hypothetical protein
MDQTAMRFLLDFKDKHRALKFLSHTMTTTLAFPFFLTVGVFAPNPENPKTKNPKTKTRKTQQNETKRSFFFVREMWP